MPEVYNNKNGNIILLTNPGEKTYSYQFDPSVKLALSEPGRPAWGNECKETLQRLPNSGRQLLQETQSKAETCIYISVITCIKNNT